MMEVGLVGSKENCMEVDFFPKKVPESCRCSELEERSRISEAKCLELERQNELLKRRVEELEKENELKVLKRGNVELNQQAEDEDEDDIVEAAMEFHAPGSRIGTPYIGTPCIVGEDGRLGSRSQLKLGKARKCLTLKEDGNCSKKLAPSVPGVAMPASSIVIIFDSDDERVLACGNMHPENCKSKTDSLLEETRVSEMEIKDVTCRNSNDEDSLEDFAPSSLTPRQRRRVRKIVTSESESENGVTRPASSIVNVFYSDDEPELACRKTHPENGKRITDCLLEETRESEMEIKDVKYQNFDDVEDSLEDCAPSSLTPRRGRRRVRKIVTSESESENGDDDDNVPISQLFKSHIQKEHSNDTTSKLRDYHVDLTRDDNVLISELLNSHIQKEHSDDASSKLHDESMDPTLPGPEKSRSSSRVKKRRRLVKTREIQGNSTSQNVRSNCCRAIPDTEEIEDDSENDDSGMADFIVDVDSGEDVEDGDSGSEQEDASDDSGAKSDNALQNLSDDDETYPEIISRFRRKKVNKSVWESEGDMLVAFNEFPEVCMRAVCALYRKQTDDERDTKETIHQNAQGFNQPDAERGSILGEYLLGGNPSNNMEMTAEEFEASDPGGVSSCEELARRYSKQLFDIYRNNEDPDFHPVIPDDDTEV